MPQLVKGGKYIYGWTRIHPDGRIRVPDEAFLEYHFSIKEVIILMSGSRTSGGFSVNRPERLQASEIGQRIMRLINLPEASHSFPSPGSQVFKSGGRIVTQVILEDGMNFRLSDELINTLGLMVGNNLLVGRGSGLGLTFIAQGRIFKEALRRKDLEAFQ
jgi:hypothetical protein